MKTLDVITRLAFGCLVLGLWTSAGAQTITSVSPTKVAAGDVANVTIFGSGIGSIADVAEFPGGNTASPITWGTGWIRVRVPETWSGNIRVWSAANLSWSNSINLDVYYNYSQTKWKASDLPLQWWLNQNGAPGCTVDQTRSALVLGYDAWECSSNVSTTYMGTTPALGNSRTDGVNVQIWTTSGWSSGTIAVTSWRYNSITGDIWEFDINYNAQHFNWACDGDASKMDVGNIGTHEMGHSIGLLDEYGSADFDDTMYGFGTEGETLRRSPNYDDTLGAEYMYPRAGRPNMTAGAPAGWHGAISPRNAADATSTSAPLPATLTGNATSYISIGGTNNGLDCASPGALQRLYLDDVYVYWLSWGSVWGQGATFGLWPNNGLAVRGGRHTLQVDYDIDNEIVESNEFDNVYAEQFVWSPYVLANLLALNRSAPPDEGTFAANNCDGFRFTGNWWGAVGVLPHAADDDYDAYVFNDYAGSQTGFSSSLEHSFSGAGQSDFVLVNGNQVGNGFTRYAGTSSYNATSGANAQVEQSNAVGTTLVPSDAYGAEVSSGGIVMGSASILRVHEVYLSDPAITYRFTMDNLTGSANLNMSLYDATGDYFGKWDYVAAGLTAVDGGDETFEYQPAAAGYFAVVVWKNDSTDHGLANTYELRVGKALSNLTALNAPGGYYGPIVPRSLPDATILNVPISPILNGNAADTYVNWATQNEGPYNMPAWTSETWLDGDVFLAQQSWSDDNTPAIYVALNRGPITVRGGRHTISQIVDPTGAVAENDESDNFYEEQFVWSPLPTTKDVPVVRFAPPDPGTGLHPNSDAMSFTRTAGHSWVAAMASHDATDDYDLIVYDDYAGSTSGLSNAIGSSLTGGSATEFVVGHFSASATTVYPSAIEWSSSSSQHFTADQSDTQGHRAGESGAYTETLDPEMIVDVYGALLASGNTYTFTLNRLSGTDDIAMAIFPSGGVHGRSGALVYSSASTGFYDVFEFTATANAWYPVVVYRTDGAQHDETVKYELTWGAGVITALPGEGPTEFSFRGGFPNPSPGNTVLQFALPSAGPVQMTIHNVRGQRVKTLVSEFLPAGAHQKHWDGRDERGGVVASGTYWVRLNAAGRTETKRVTVLR